MADLFDEIIVCNGCGKKMNKVVLIKNGFQIRAFQCDKCKKRIYHPGDIEEYKRFMQLKQRPFAVKLRMVGNSYTVSIPREIVDFMQESEREQREREGARQAHQRFMRMQNEMVKVFFEEFGKISLMFSACEGKTNGENNKEQEREGEQEKEETGNNENTRLHKLTKKRLKEA